MLKGLYVDQTKYTHEPTQPTRHTLHAQLFDREPLNVSELENGMIEAKFEEAPRYPLLGTRDVPGTKSSTSQMPPPQPHRSPGRGIREWQGQSG